MLSYKINNRITFDTKEISLFELSISRNNYSSDINRKIQKIISSINSMCVSIIDSYIDVSNTACSNASLQTMQVKTQRVKEKIQSVKSDKNMIKSFNDTIGNMIGRKIDLTNIIITIDKIIDEMDNVKTVIVESTNEMFGLMS